MSDRCFKHPRRKAIDQWKFCSDPADEWKGVCTECDLELNKMALRFAYPRRWRKLLKAYKEAA